MIYCPLLGGNENVKTSSVLIDSGFKMNDVQCIDCGEQFSFFTFVTQNFTLSSAVFERINY
jgi:hypothetical protein